MNSAEFMGLVTGLLQFGVAGYALRLNRIFGAKRVGWANAMDTMMFIAFRWVWWHALRRTGGVQKRAAELLKIKPTTLHEIIKRLGSVLTSIIEHELNARQKLLEAGVDVGEVGHGEQRRRRAQHDDDQRSLALGSASPVSDGGIFLRS